MNMLSDGTGILKWPSRLTLIRHVSSAYQQFKKDQEASPLYQAFRNAYMADPESLETVRLAKIIEAKTNLNHNAPNSKVPINLSL